MFKRLGRRGAFLLTMGAVWVLYGYALLTTAAPPSLGRVLWIPLHTWGWIWITGGSAAMLFSWTRKVGRDSIGFVGIIIPAVGWASGFVYTWMFYDAARSWVSAAVWAAVSAMTIVVAGWPEPPQTHHGGSGGD